MFFGEIIRIQTLRDILTTQKNRCRRDRDRRGEMVMLRWITCQGGNIINKTIIERQRLRFMQGSGHLRHFEMRTMTVMSWQKGPSRFFSTEWRMKKLALHVGESTQLETVLILCYQHHYMCIVHCLLLSFFPYFWTVWNRSGAGAIILACWSSGF